MLMLFALPTLAEPFLPEPVATRYPGLKTLGEARVRVFGFHIYDATLWAAGREWRMEEPFALDLRYARNFKGEALAEQSVEEIAKLGIGDEPKRKRWGELMRNVFPDVAPGDRLIGVSNDGRVARFYSARGFLGAIEDAEFTRAFFAIWLDPRTREPAARTKLLGLAP